VGSISKSNIKIIDRGRLEYELRLNSHRNVIAAQTYSVIDRLINYRLALLCDILP
jgi:hypothetical protein